ncbi:Phosphoinositide-3-kinase adaptor protein 1 [Nesidiocoris tenuis]|uniref:Phosphoinositide-3-kinase adaptor protein 1 n=1 Tax=Nesidiocoris tenuis TaxID=355587 RepID=A0ABN7AK44_9HEMI|nr:Phosphoinositide-3-kinase adaptor protein 1 [Nesidiocoris tenuis]
MLDITIVSSRDSEAAHLWVNYLASCFLQISKDEHKPPFKLAKVNAEDVLMGLSVEGACGSRLQIVIVCPVFLDALASNPGAPILASMLQPASVLAMLLGVSQQTLEGHHLSNLFRFEQWRKQTVKDQDATFVGDFLGVAMDILSRTWQLQQAMAQLKLDNNRAHFSVSPKKIKVGQNKVLILLNDPVSANDKISISVDKNGTKIDVPVIKRRNPYTLQFSMPSSCLQTSVIVAVNVERNGRSLGHKLVKCESKLRELDQLLRTTDNPLVFMCQSLGITNVDKDQLDDFLVSAFKKNMPPNFNLLNSHPLKNGHSKEEYPTLLHFAAKYGLEKLCWQLIECPGGEYACQMQNCNQHNPADIAQYAGHTKLANALHGYLKIWHQMTELTSMYTYLKEVTEKPAGKESVEFGDGNYLLPRPINDTYLIPPKARPVVPTSLPLHDGYQSPSSVPRDYFAEHLQSPKDGALAMPPLTTKEAFQIPPSPTEDYQMPLTPKEIYNLPGSPMENYQSPPHARPFTPMTPSTPSSPLDGPKFSTAYLHMHSPVSDNGSHCSHFDQILGPEKKYTSHPSNENLSIASSGGHHYINTSCSASTCSKSPQDELLEIINDFKNNVFTISEVEKLVENWRNRNDVQQSFREKQEQLNQMRQEYEKIQNQMKEQLKRATPFDRIKKFFSRKHKHDGCPKTKGQSDAVCHRPVSSLSLHSSCSSSSSGRMSTASGTSLGDSGTHSDPDEKKSEISSGEKSSPTQSHGPDFTFPDSRLQAVQEHEAITSCDDEYVKACPNERLPPLALPPRRFGFPPPFQVEKTVVEVHRSDETLKKSEDKIQQDEPTVTKTLGEKAENENENLEDDKVSEAGKTDILENTEMKSEEPRKMATLAKMESDDDEMEILEQSDKLLKDIAETLPNYESQEDALSPPESAFTENGSFIEESRDTSSDQVELDTKDEIELETKESSESSDNDQEVNRAEDGSRDGSDEKEDSSSNEEEPLLKEEPAAQMPNSRHERTFANYYVNVDHTATLTKDSNKMAAKFGANKQQSQCRSQGYMNVETVPEQMREYVNVCVYPKPPLPPKFKYKNVLL